MLAPGVGLHATLLVAYLLVLVGVGAWKARRIRSQEDFSLAGRGLSTTVLVGTLLATWIGTGSIFGNAEESMRVGLDGFLLPIAGGLGILALFFLAGRIRGHADFTIQDILERRFGVGARLLGTVTLLLAYVIIVSYQYRAGASVVAYLLPEELRADAQTWIVCVVAVFVIVYTALAGLFSVAYTDVANGLLMSLGIFCALPILWSAAGGLEGALASLPEPSRELFGHYGPRDLLNVLLPSFLLLLGDANMFQRFFSARTPESARRSALYMFFGVLVLECAIILTAVLGAGLVAQGTVSAPANPAHIVLHLAFHELPTFLGAMLVATVVAVVVSTADSYLLSPATSLVRDVYQRFLRPGAGDLELVRTGRLVVVGLGLVALGLAFTSDAFFGVALFAYTLYGVGITPALIAALLWPRATRAGALCSIAGGVGTAITWKVLTTEGSRDWIGAHGLGWLSELGVRMQESGFDAILPSFAVSLVLLVGVSLAGAAPRENPQ